MKNYGLKEMQKWSSLLVAAYIFSPICSLKNAMDMQRGHPSIVNVKRQIGRSDCISSSSLTTTSTSCNVKEEMANLNLNKRYLNMNK
jgi:hypothetical protein